MKKLIKKINIRTLICLGIILLSIPTGLYFYPWLPYYMVMHWDIAGQPDSALVKSEALIIMPTISAIMFLIYLAIPHIPLLNANLEKFRKFFDNFMIALFSFLYYIYLITILWSIYYNFNIIQLLAPGFSALFICTGILIENAKQNWAVGIRTPWTLSNEKVWDKTHKVGAVLFKITGLIALLGVIWPDLGLYFILIPVIFVTIYTVVYSFLVYQGEQKKKKSKK